MIKQFFGTIHTIALIWCLMAAYYLWPDFVEWLATAGMMQ